MGERGSPAQISAKNLEARSRFCCCLIADRSEFKNIAVIIRVNFPLLSFLCLM